MILFEMNTFSYLDTQLSRCKKFQINSIYLFYEVFFRNILEIFLQNGPFLQGTLFSYLDTQLSRCKKIFFCS